MSDRPSKCWSPLTWNPFQFGVFAGSMSDNKSISLSSVVQAMTIVKGRCICSSWNDGQLDCILDKQYRGGDEVILYKISSLSLATRQKDSGSGHKQFIFSDEVTPIVPIVRIVLIHSLLQVQDLRALPMVSTTASSELS
jgi:hypothetical protein